jgi:hypothetical protein
VTAAAVVGLKQIRRLQIAVAEAGGRKTTAARNNLKQRE